MDDNTEIALATITWQGPEYAHEEKSADFIWTIALITLVAVGIAVWLANYVFAIFIFIAGCCLILFSIRPPEMVDFSIETEGMTIGKAKYGWKSIKGFRIVKGDPYAKLLIETSRKFLPIFTIPLPSERATETKETLLKVIPETELEESRSMKLMEKLGF
jgi:hypothetical protein